MSKILRLAALMMALAVVAVPATMTIAQDKKEAKKSEKNASGTIEVGESKNGKFYFTIRDGSGKYICGSTPVYASKDAVKKSIESLKEVLVTAKMVDKKVKE